MPYEGIYFATLRNEAKRRKGSLGDRRLDEVVESEVPVEEDDPASDLLHEPLSSDSNGDEPTETNNDTPDISPEQLAPSLPPLDPEIPDTDSSNGSDDNDMPSIDPLPNDESKDDDDFPIAPEATNSTRIPSDGSTYWPLERPTQVLNLAMNWSMNHEAMAVAFLVPVVLFFFLVTRSVNRCYKNIHDRREKHELDLRAQQANDLLGELQMVSTEEEDGAYFT